VVRYSFLVGLFHSLLHAGLARRTDSAILRQSRLVPDEMRVFYEQAPDAATLERMKAVVFPASDPVSGPDGPLVKAWRRA
jgi:hypothetical protein